MALFTRTAASCRNSCGAVLILLPLLAGCATTGSSKSSPSVEDSVATARTPESAGATTTEEVSLPPAPTTPATSEAPAPERPSGEVPSDLIGRWVGGEGSRSGYTLTFWADGRYQLSHDRSTGIPQFVERGLAGGKGYEIVLRPVEVAGSVERIERRARWSVQKAPDVYGYDIEVLVLVDIYGEFSYVKDE